MKIKKIVGFEAKKALTYFHKVDESAATLYEGNVIKPNTFLINLEALKKDDGLEVTYLLRTIQYDKEKLVHIEIVHADDFKDIFFNSLGCISKQFINITDLPYWVIFAISILSTYREKTSLKGRKMPGILSNLVYKGKVVTTVDPSIKYKIGDISHFSPLVFEDSMMVNFYELWKMSFGQSVKTEIYKFKSKLAEEFKIERDPQNYLEDISNRRFEKYGGYNGFDDDTIDAAFEGDPDLTWNID